MYLIAHILNTYKYNLRVHAMQSTHDGIGSDITHSVDMDALVFIGQTI